MSFQENVESTLLRVRSDAATPEVVKQMGAYLEEVALWSERMHLIGRGRTRQNLELLLLDSLLLLRVAEESVFQREPGRAWRVADIGTGAGFPGVVWKICIPGLDVTLFERRTKPQLFLQRVAAQLGLLGASVVGADASTFRERGSFDLAASKAAGRLDTILPLAEGLLRSGGAYVTIKGQRWRDELAERAVRGIRLEATTELPERRGFALVFRKE